jgi:hypothetical protein
VPLVIGGKDAWLLPEPGSGHVHVNGRVLLLTDSPHTFLPVVGHMLRQICLDYGSLPNIETIDMDGVVFFYEGLRAELRRRTAPQEKK